VDFDEFVQLLRTSLPVGVVLDNPGGGTSTVLSHDAERVCYRRGGSRFYVPLRELHEAYIRFSGQEVTTRSLKDYSPEVFDSARGGHNCHATFLFLALQRMNLSGEIWGRGRIGSPFGVTISNGQP
jgi:hypothetical protein